jgi:NAD(P)-dependent dehydrogenase (short-subunit alcohol dehydrogenase family)
MTYTIAKMGLWAFTRTAAQALAPDIRVNAIGPGPTLRGAPPDRGHFEAQRAATILERGATPPRSAPPCATSSTRRGSRAS